MLDFFFELPNNDKITLLGILFTVISSFFTLLISLKLNRKSSYVSSITNERINSMSQLKQNTANYLSILKYYIFDEGNNISIEKLYNLKLHIEFQLNNIKENENLIIKRMDTINILINYLNEIKQATLVKEIITGLKSKGFKEENIPIPYTEDTLLSIEKTKMYLKRLINMELNLLEQDLKKHIKFEWEKIKEEI